MWATVSAGVLFLNEHASSSARTLLSASNQIIGAVRHTSQTIYSPLFELFEGNVGCRRSDIEIQAMLVLQGLVCWRRKLLLSMIKTSPSLRINSSKVLSNHGCGVVAVQSSGDDGGISTTRFSEGDATRQKRICKKRTTGISATTCFFLLFYLGG